MVLPRPKPLRAWLNAAYDLAQFRELAAFSQFSTDLDAETRHPIERGQRLTELLKQPQYSPYAVWEMYASLLAATQGCFDKVPVEKIKLAEEALLRELKTKHAKLTRLLIRATNQVTPTRRPSLKLPRHRREVLQNKPKL